jgi:hypothetical protein
MAILEESLLKHLALSSFSLVFVLSACGNDGAGDDPATDTLITFEGDDDDATDTAVPLQDYVGNVGSIFVVHYPPSMNYEADQVIAAGLFTDADGGIINMTQCLVFGGLCIDAYPAVGESAEPNPNTDFLNAVTFYDVGDPILVGDNPVNIDAGFTVPVYLNANLSDFGTGTGIQFDGDYMPYSGTDDFAFTDLIETSSPPTDETTVVGPGDTLDFSWTAGGTGEVYLTVNEIIYQLEDTGDYSLTLDDLVLSAPLDVVSASLSRQTHTEVDAAGNTIQVQTVSEQVFSIAYEDVEGWTELELDVSWSEDCDGAELLSPIPAGQYYGDLTDLLDDHDLGYNNPTTGWATEGFEGVSAVALLAGETLTATMKQTTYDAAVYILDDDCDPSEPLAGTDDTLNGEEEVVEYTATDDETVYLVMDGWFEGGTFSLVLDIQ